LAWGAPGCGEVDQAKAGCGGFERRFVFKEFDHFVFFVFWVLLGLFFKDMHMQSNTYYRISAILQIPVRIHESKDNLIIKKYLQSKLRSRKSL